MIDIEKIAENMTEDEIEMWQEYLDRYEENCKQMRDGLMDHAEFQRKRAQYFLDLAEELTRMAEEE